MPHETGLIALIAAAFVGAMALGYLAQRLRMPPLVGYLLAGIAIGPFTPGFVGDVGLAQQLAEVGVILLMFGVGLHFSFGTLWEQRRIALPGAVVQILVATGVGAALALVWGWALPGALVLGLALSVASTVVLLRALEQRRAVDSDEGRIAVGWLVVEDLVMVLALVFLPALAPQDGPAAGGAQLAAALLRILLEVSLFVGAMLVVGRRVVPWLLALVARSGSRELFTLSVLAVALGLAFGSSALFGVSFALGAFFAGVVLSESDLSHEAAEKSLPLQDAFAVLFFVSVGMLFDPAIVLHAPLQLLAVLAIVVLVKSLAAFLIVVAFGHSRHTALTIAASLAQIGEFSFILAGLGVTLHLLPEQGRDLVLAAALLSIMLNPLVFACIGPLERWLGRHAAAPMAADVPAGTQVAVPADHAIIVGYGRVGERVARALARQQVPFAILERNPRRRAAAGRDFAGAIVAADAVEEGALETAGIARARVLVVATPDGFHVRHVLQRARRLNPGIVSIVRTHSDEERTALASQGVEHVVMGEQELALAMARCSLARFGRELPQEAA